MRVVTTALLLLTAACAGSDAGYQWTKAGLTVADLQKDTFDCERETRMVAHTFSPGLFRDAEANAYAGRCMTAKGYTLVRVGAGSMASPAPAIAPGPVSDATGRQYNSTDRVNCRFRTVASVELPAKTCSQGGGTILGPAG